MVFKLFLFFLFNNNNNNKNEYLSHRNSNIFNYVLFFIVKQR